LTGFSYQPTKIVLRRPLESAQYACGDYLERLRRRKIAVSMSRPANPYDNAKAESFIAESFIKTLKSEEIDGKAYANLEDARLEIGAFIEIVYNARRLHSALGYKPPAEFEADLGRKTNRQPRKDEALSPN
jgi:transposase InsO family protein